MHLPSSSLSSPPSLLSPPSLPSPSLTALAVHDPQWYAFFTSQLTPEHAQLVQEMLMVAAYRKQYKGQWSVECCVKVWGCCVSVECCVRVWSKVQCPVRVLGAVRVWSAVCGCDML